MGNFSAPSTVLGFSPPENQQKNGQIRFVCEHTQDHFSSSPSNDPNSAVSCTTSLSSLVADPQYVEPVCSNYPYSHTDVSEKQPKIFALSYQNPSHASGWVMEEVYKPIGNDWTDDKEESRNPDRSLECLASDLGWPIDDLEFLMQCKKVKSDFSWIQIKDLLGNGRSAHECRQVYLELTLSNLIYPKYVSQYEVSSNPIDSNCTYASLKSECGEFLETPVPRPKYSDSNQLSFKKLESQAGRNDSKTTYQTKIFPKTRSIESNLETMPSDSSPKSRTSDSVLVDYSSLTEYLQKAQTLKKHPLTERAAVPELRKVFNSRGYQTYGGIENRNSPGQEQIIGQFGSVHSTTTQKCLNPGEPVENCNNPMSKIYKKATMVQDNKPTLHFNKNEILLQDCTAWKEEAKQARFNTQPGQFEQQTITRSPNEIRQIAKKYEDRAATKFLNALLKPKPVKTNDLDSEIPIKTNSPNSQDLPRKKNSTSAKSHKIRRVKMPAKCPSSFTAWNPKKSNSEDSKRLERLKFSKSFESSDSRERGESSDQDYEEQQSEAEETSDEEYEEDHQEEQKIETANRRSGQYSPTSTKRFGARMAEVKSSESKEKNRTKIRVSAIVREKKRAMTPEILQTRRSKRRTVAESNDLDRLKVSTDTEATILMLRDECDIKFGSIAYILNSDSKNVNQQKYTGAQLAAIYSRATTKDASSSYRSSYYEEDESNATDSSNEFQYCIPFSELEEQKLLDLKEAGALWPTIMKHFPSRTENYMRSRWKEIKSCRSESRKQVANGRFVQYNYELFEPDWSGKFNKAGLEKDSIKYNPASDIQKKLSIGTNKTPIKKEETGLTDTEPFQIQNESIAVSV
ncbi:uncharacterized protein V1516DRAFT_663488 [Lipomyces oligophaga]|uniref:uncharacterized protein n=1 Tax=Lipomyces oligophaga TaxID=45792 RepID=UPI0034CE0383